MKPQNIIAGVLIAGAIGGGIYVVVRHRSAPRPVPNYDMPPPQLLPDAFTGYDNMTPPAYIDDVSTAQPPPAQPRGTTNVSEVLKNSPLGKFMRAAGSGGKSGGGVDASEAMEFADKAVDVFGKVASFF